MAIERKKGRRFSREKSTRSTSPLGAFKVLLVLVIIIPIAFYFIAPEVRSSFINYQMGNMYERLDNISTARRYYSTAYTSSGKKNIQARYKYVQMCNKLKDYNEAYKTATNMIEKSPVDQVLFSNVYLEQGIANEGLESYDAALLSYSRGAKLNSDNYFVLIGLGRTYRIKGDYRRSRQHLEDAVNIHKLRSPEAHYELGLTYIAEGNNADALDEFDYVLSQLPSRELRHKAQQKKLEIVADR